MSTHKNWSQRRMMRRKQLQQAHLEAQKAHYSNIQKSVWAELKCGALAVLLRLLVLVSAVILGGCGTPQTQARVVYQAPPRPDAALLTRPNPVPELVEPITEESVLLKHADEAAERNGLAAPLNGLIDWVEKVTE